MGYKLAWQSTVQNTIATAEAEARELLTFVAEGVADAKTGLLFMDASPAVLSVKLLQAMSKQAPVLIFQREDLLGADAASLAVSLREQGFGRQRSSAAAAADFGQQPELFAVAR